MNQVAVRQYAIGGLVGAAIATVITLVTVGGSSSSQSSPAFEQFPPFTKPLFTRKTSNSTEIVAHIERLSCMDLLFVDVAQHGQVDRFGNSPGVPSVSAAGPPVMVVAGTYDSVLVHANSDVADVAWVDTLGHHDHMHPVLGWAVLSGGVEQSYNSRQTGAVIGSRLTAVGQHGVVLATTTIRSLPRPSGTFTAPPGCRVLSSP